MQKLMDLLLMRKQLWFICWPLFSNTSTASLQEFTYQNQNGKTV